MPKNKNETLCVEDLRHAEYYECKTPLMIYMPKVRMEIFSLILWILSYREKIYYWHIEISKQMQAVKQQEQTVQ
ncbi:hypothetical protein GVanDAA622_02920 [Enterococcus faecium]|nr:hypothetical protein GVanDAA622_02920 [Enterococcus faecium]